MLVLGAIRGIAAADGLFGPERSSPGGPVILKTFTKPLPRDPIPVCKFVHRTAGAGRPGNKARQAQEAIHDMS